MTHPGRASSSSLSESRRSHSTRSASYWCRLYAPATPGIMWPSTDSATSPGQPIAASSVTGKGVEAAPDQGLSENHEARQGVADVPKSGHTPMMQQRIHQ